MRWSQQSTNRFRCIGSGQSLSAAGLVLFDREPLLPVLGYAEQLSWKPIYISVGCHCAGDHDDHRLILLRHRRMIPALIKTLGGAALTIVIAKMAKECTA